MRSPLDGAPCLPACRQVVRPLSSPIYPLRSTMATAVAPAELSCSGQPEDDNEERASPEIPAQYTRALGSMYLTSLVIVWVCTGR